MRALLLLIVTATLIVCPLTQLVIPDAPPTLMPTATDTPAAAPSTDSQPRVEISASAASLRVGETVTLSGVPVNIGLPYYTLMLSSGDSITLTYDNQVRSTLGANAPFELVSALGELNRVTFVLRARVSITLDATISATGEVKTPEGAYMWGYGSSAALTLTVTE